MQLRQHWMELMFLLGFDDLIKNKETVGRQIDLSDVLQLKLRKKDKGE